MAEIAGGAASEPEQAVARPEAPVAHLDVQPSQQRRQ
jgi:hypothetical protein